MSESSDDLSGPARANSLLTEEEFEVIFQVTKELPNMREDRLETAGMTIEDVRSLLAVLRVCRAELRSDSLVSIGVEAEGSANNPGNVVHVTIPEPLASKWLPLTELVISALEDLGELWLRTGYRSDVIRDATALLPR